MTDEEKFIQSLYEEANGQLKEVYKEQKDNRDKLLQEIALILLAYSIAEGVMSLTIKDKAKEHKRLSTLIIGATRGQRAIQEKVLTNILKDTVDKTFKFYSYNADLKDVRKIVEDNFKGKHFSERIWKNEKVVGEHLQKQVKQFLDGKINVNQIKKDIEKTYNSNAYEARRLAETEVNRCEDEAFNRFCKEVGVVKVRRNEVLDRRTCDECASLDGKIYDLDEAPGVVHPLCRGFNTIEDDKSYDKVDYMSNRFVPTFGEEREFKLGALSINEKKVSNSKFDMWTDLATTKKNKAVRLYEKKIQGIINTLPEGLELPKFSIIDFEKVGLNRKAIGGYQRQLNTIFINSKYDTDTKILKYLKNNEGYFASVESNSPLLHELGHKYHYDLAEIIANQNGMSYNNAKVMFDESISRYILNQSSVPRSFISEQLSKYASDEFDGQDRINEIMAEYFSVKDSTKTELVQFIESYISEVMER